MVKLVFIILIFFFLTAIYWTIYLKFPFFSKMKCLKGIKKDDMHTFFLSLATNLGVGNIIGVSSAIIIGGPGTIFWMLIFSFFISSLSYIETYYAVKSQTTIESEIVGGTCYTIDKFIKGQHKVFLSIIFAIFLMLSNSIFFTPVQLNTIYNVFEGKNKIIFILLTSIIILFVVLKGAKSIVKITDNIVPIMTITFLVVIIWGILLKKDNLLNVMNIIIKDAFSFKSCLAGSFITLFNTAITKSLFSNEAGLGTMPSLTGVSKKEDIEKTAYLQMTSVIVDTCILCVITGVFILLYYDENMALNSSVFVECMHKALGKNGLVISKVLVYVFGFSSAIGLYYLGESNALYFSYKLKINKNISKFAFQLLYILGMIIALFGEFNNLLLLVDFGLVVLGTINILILFKVEKRQKFLKNNSIKTLEEKF